MVLLIKLFLFAEFLFFKLILFVSVFNRSKYFSLRSSLSFLFFELKVFNIPFI